MKYVIALVSAAKTTRFYTALGFTAIFLWSLSALFSITLKSIPTFEILSLAFSICFLLTLIKLVYTRQWHMVKQPLGLWLTGSLGIFGTEACFVSAFKFAPPAQVVLLFHTWPIIVFSLAALFYKEKFTIKHFFACLVCLMGICIILLDKVGLAGFTSLYIRGYLIAVFGAVVWGFYVISLRHFKHHTTDLVGFYLGASALLSLLAHCSFETTVIPTPKQCLAIILMGLTSQGLAYIFWNTAIKKGNHKLLFLLSYSNPIIANTLLILAGFTQLSLKLIVACALVVLSNILA